MTESVASLAVQVVARATARGVRIAVAESLTGGLLAASIVAVPGASKVFSGGVIAYDTELKHRLLGVNEELLASSGPVHPQVAIDMALGVRTACAVSRGEAGIVPAEYGLATTGVAGPDPDMQSGQAAGTVWLGLSTPTDSRAEPLALRGDRAEIREASVRAALGLLLSAIEND